MNIQLSDHFTYRKLIRFSLPSIAMMIFTSIYGVVDGIFVSNFVGKTEFAALNLIYPFLMIAGALGFMLGTGGTALTAKTFGEGDRERANSYFSMITYMALIISSIIAAVCFIFLEPIAILLGADSNMLPHCMVYGGILLASLPFFMLQNIFQCFTMTAEKPKFGLYVTVAAGLTNIVGDALLVGVLKLGLPGAAAASAASQVVGGVIPLIYFARKNGSPLKLGKFYFKLFPFFIACTNGISEFVSNISSSLVIMLYNYRLMELAGENGISAFGIIMYTQFIFVGIYYGYSLATAPVISYHYGADNRAELKNLLKRSVVLIGTVSVSAVAFAELAAPLLSGIFASYDPALYEMTTHAFRIYSISYVLCGFNIFGSAFFTALNNGIVSGILSFLRTLVFQLASLIFLPMLLPDALKLDGIWFAIVAAELLSITMTVIFTAANRKKYGYL